MIEALRLAAALAVGILLGAVFFGGLWWTVFKSFSSKQPAAWFLSSLLLRTGFVLTGFYFAARGGWKSLLVCLLGFVAARMMVIRVTRVLEETTCPAQAASHAP